MDENSINQRMLEEKLLPVPGSGVQLGIRCFWDES